MPVLTGALKTVSKSFVRSLEELEIWGRIKTIQTTVLLRSVRILRWVLETWGDLLSLGLEWKTINKQWYKKFTSITIGLERGLEEFEIKWRIETIQTIVEICQNSLKNLGTWGDLLPLKLQRYTASSH